MAATEPLGEPQALLFLCLLHSKRSTEKRLVWITPKKVVMNRAVCLAFGHCSFKSVALPLYPCLCHVILSSVHSVTNVCWDAPAQSTPPPCLTETHNRATSWERAGSKHRQAIKARLIIYLPILTCHCEREAKLRAKTCCVTSRTPNAGSNAAEKVREGSSLKQTPLSMWSIWWSVLTAVSLWTTVTEVHLFSEDKESMAPRG